MEKFQAGQGIPWGRRWKKITRTHTVYFMSGTVLSSLYPLSHLMSEMILQSRYLTISNLYMRSVRLLTCPSHMPSKRQTWNLSPGNLAPEPMFFNCGLKWNWNIWITFVLYEIALPFYIGRNSNVMSVVLWRENQNSHSQALS